MCVENIGIAGRRFNIIGFVFRQKSDMPGNGIADLGGPVMVQRYPGLIFDSAFILIQASA